ncbi:hypothetical protein [Streptacidiphilus sp. P02-A3a]|uniref:hypothetical protein n=1 Tax=Streptacidiphilus sp. P02-A3a TaxID=2704468 RepID=UPI0015F8793A|nr:hypothetical protein [Streptacidiphilus sp. P02-A3a]QMU73206.1 hypothetical protein GXP74_38220 [Streptacidiphilus sp. P02-A3a]
MTTQPVPSPSDPRQLLAMRRVLVHRVRREQRGAWFPLLVFAAVRFGAAPVVRYGQGDHGVGDLPPAMWYWPVALSLAYAAISWFYLRRGDRLGLGTRVGPYLALGIALLVIITGYVSWTAMHPGFLDGLHGPSPVGLFFNTVVSPAGTIGLALLLLARIERSWPLLAVTSAYLVIMLSSGSLPDPSAWGFLPGLLAEGGVLLIGGVGLGLLQRFQGRSAA